MLIKPPLYTDLTFSPIRSAQPIGIWQLGSYLRSRGFENAILDCVIEGWENKTYLKDGAPFDYPATMRRKTSILLSEGPDAILRSFPVCSADGQILRTLIRTGLEEERIIDRVKAFDPGWIGISIIATSEHRGAMDLARRLRSEFPESIIIAGGQHATDMPLAVLCEGTIDFVAKGNGELIMERLMRGQMPDRGLAYLKDGRLVEQTDAPITPLEALPPLDPSLLSHVIYPLPATHSYQTSGRRYADFMLSFGCHKRCDFCRQGLVREGYRHLSMEKLEAQLRLFKDHGIEELVLQDDSLLGGPSNDGKDFFLQAAKLIKSYGLYWHDNGGVEFERLDSDLVDSLLRLNDGIGEGKCTALYIPFNPRHLIQTRVVEKHMRDRPDKIMLLKRLKENGIYTFTSGIWGHVQQDIADMGSDIRGYEELLSSGVIDQAIVFSLSYLPRTKDWDFRRYIVDMDDWEGFSIFVPHAGTANASFSEVQHMVLEAYMRLNRLQPDVEPWASGFPPHVPYGWK